jgi:hypothetical protein
MTKHKSEDELKLELDGETLDLLLSHDADRFALALDRHGWMIVAQPENEDEARWFMDRERRWFMNGTTKECPPWADPKCPHAGEFMQVAFGHCAAQPGIE